MYSKFVLAIRFCLAEMAIYWLESRQWPTVISSSAVYSMCNSSPGQLTKYIHCMVLCTLTLWNLTYCIYCRYKGKGWTPSKPLGIWCSCQTQAYGHKKDITNKRVLVKDMTVICNKEDAVSVDMFIQELCGEPYNLILLYKRQHETDKQCPSLTEDIFFWPYRLIFSDSCMNSMHTRWYALMLQMVPMHTDLS